MITNRLFSIALFIGILCFACPAVAGEAQLSCDSIQEIAVGKGTEHLAGGSEKTVYVACVYLTPTNNPLKSILANYPGERITIQCGENLIEVPRPDISTDGSWFSIICSTPGDALAAGNSICADKVTSYLP